MSSELREALWQLVHGRSWLEQARCADADPDIFFADPDKRRGREMEEKAKAVCATCSVTEECLEFAIANNETEGVWGGLNEREIRKLKKSLRAEQRRREEEREAARAKRVVVRQVVIRKEAGWR